MDAETLQRANTWLAKNGHSGGMPQEEKKEVTEVTVAELDTLVKLISEQRAVIEEADRITASMNIELARLQGKVVQYLKELNRDNYKSPHGTVSVKQNWRVNLPQTDEDKKALFEHLRERGIFDRYATVNSQSLNSLYMADWAAATQEGRGMDFRMPGIGEPKLFEALSYRKK